MKLSIMPGPAFCAASAVSTKMPVPMMRADAEHRQLEGAQRAMQRLLLGRGEDGVERLYAPENHSGLPPDCGRGTPARRMRRPTNLIG